MNDNTALKVSGTAARAGADGEVTLVRGDTMAMRLWRNEEPHEEAPHTTTYETLGYVLAGRAELTVGGSTIRLEPGDSYLVPARVEHSYRILETFSAVECTAPPVKGLE